MKLLHLVAIPLILTSVLTFGNTPQTLKIAKIDFEGLNRLSVAEVTAIIDLKVGDTFSIVALDTAAQTLIDSGMFRNVAYRTKAIKSQINIIFTVEESSVRSSQVIFDNFIWFSDAELLTAVRRDVPTFNGSAPDNGDIAERVAKSLERLLHEQKIEATVSHMTSQDSLGSTSQEEVFTVNGVPMPICSIRFPGSNNVSEAKLIESAKPLLNSEYSKKFVSLFATNNLIPLYRERGQLKAEFSPPSGRPEATSTCKSGVELTLPVAEGPIYKWTKANWLGNRTLTQQELDAALAMRTGEIANGVQFDIGIKNAEKAYGRNGFLLARVRATADFNDAAETVGYKLEVTEGPLFHMSRFAVKGFPETLAGKIKERWRLTPGEVYDDGYWREFADKQLPELMHNTLMDRRNQGKPAPNLKWDSIVNRESHTVDVVLELTN